MTTTPDDEPVKALRRHSAGVSVSVEYGPPSEYPKARTITDWFELAGWPCNFNATAQERTGYPYREGIEVSGVNKHIVEIVANILSVAQITDVRSKVIENRVLNTNPKYPWVVGFVRVYVGHPIASSDNSIPSSTSGAATWLKAWTAPSVLVSVAALAIAYAALATRVHWWPF